MRAYASLSIVLAYLWTSKYMSSSAEMAFYDVTIATIANHRE